MDTLDTSKNLAGQQLVNVDEKLGLIKREMPLTYAEIQAWAGRIGNKAFEQVRRGIKGEWRCFWACEAGHCVGTRWDSDVADEQPLSIKRHCSTVVAVRLGMGVQDGAH